MPIYNKLALNLRYDNVPVLSKQSIEDIAIRIINEYSPDLLQNPQPIDIDDFTEFYLNCNIESYYLSHNLCYLGMCVFHEDTVVQTFDAENYSIVPITNLKRTILLDKRLYESDKEMLRRFTLAHECSHLILHEKYYANKRYDNTSYAAFRVENDNGHRKLETSEDWLEWQANMLASCILMNKIAVSKFLKDFNLMSLKKNHLYRTYVVQLMAEKFQVSLESARIRLSQLFNELVVNNSL